MSPSHFHVRHLTWPPNLHLIPKSMTKASFTTQHHTDYIQPLPKIAEEEDPFSHFLSPVLEEEDEDVLDGTTYSAGITPYISNSKAKQEALALRCARIEEKWENYAAKQLLRTSRHGKTSRKSIPAPLPPPFPQTPPGTPPGEEALPDLDDDMDLDAGASSPDEAASPKQMVWYFPSTMSSHDNDMDMDSDSDVDGWEADRRRANEKPRGRQLQSVTPSPRRKFRSTRNLSGKKHAWREPSWDLWTVDEEEEEVDERGRSGKRRRVHWSEEVTVREFERDA